MEALGIRSRVFVLSLRRHPLLIKKRWCEVIAAFSFGCVDYIKTGITIRDTQKNDKNLKYYSCVDILDASSILDTNHNPLHYNQVSFVFFLYEVKTQIHKNRRGISFHVKQWRGIYKPFRSWFGCLDCLAWYWWSRDTHLTLSDHRGNSVGLWRYSPIPRRSCRGKNSFLER